MVLLNYTEWQKSTARKKPKKKYIPVNKHADGWLQEVDALEGSVAKLKAILAKKKIKQKTTPELKSVKPVDAKLKPDLEKEKELKSKEPVEPMEKEDVKDKKDKKEEK